MSGKARRMGAALPGYISKDNGANPNMIQFGDKLQGLASVTNMRSSVTRHVKTRAWGSTRDRHRIFCINQLGGVGNVKNSQFAPNADGVMECHNRKNTRDRWDGIYHHHFRDPALEFTKVERSYADDFESWNFQFNTVFSTALKTVLSSKVSGAYFNSIGALLTNWDGNYDSSKLGVNCDGWECGGSVSCTSSDGKTSCDNQQRLSNFFFNTEEQNIRKDLYLGWMLGNIINEEYKTASDPELGKPFRDNFGKNLVTYGYDPDCMDVWWGFGGDSLEQPAPTVANIANIISENNSFLAQIKLNGVNMPLITGINFDIEGPVMAAANGPPGNYFKDILEAISHTNVKNIQFTVAVGWTETLYWARVSILNALDHYLTDGTLKDRFNFRISFMPYAQDSILNNLPPNTCGTQLLCACYMTNKLLNNLSNVVTGCDATGQPNRCSYTDASGKTFTCLDLLKTEVETEDLEALVFESGVPLEETSQTCETFNWPGMQTYPPQSNNSKGCDGGTLYPSVWTGTGPTFTTPQGWANVAYKYGIPIFGAVSSNLNVNNGGNDVCKNCSPSVRVAQEERIILAIYAGLKKFLPELVVGKRLDGDQQYDIWLEQSGKINQPMPNGGSTCAEGTVCSCNIDCQNSPQSFAQRCGAYIGQTVPWRCPGGPGAQCTIDDHCLFKDATCELNGNAVGTCTDTDVNGDVRYPDSAHCKGLAKDDYGQGPYIDGGVDFPEQCTSNTNTCNTDRGPCND